MLGTDWVDLKAFIIADNLAPEVREPEARAGCLAWLLVDATFCGWTLGTVLELCRLAGAAFEDPSEKLTGLLWLVPDACDTRGGGGATTRAADGPDAGRGAEGSWFNSGIASSSAEVKISSSSKYSSSDIPSRRGGGKW